MEADRERIRRAMQPCQSETMTDYFRFNTWLNGNAHLWFQRKDLVERVNLLLAEYYGEVLPDAAPKDAPASSLFGAVATNLQFYPTPPDAVDALLDGWWRAGGPHRILEPSAGTGAIVTKLLDLDSTGGVTAIEVDPDRVAQLRRIRDPRVTVLEANFLRVTPTPVFDAVIMNPPFYGTHWMEHIQHAWEFLAPGGRLLSILPVSAQVNETPKHLAFRRWAEKVGRHRSYERMFRDLPPESFAASGTRINTVVLDMRKDK